MRVLKRITKALVLAAIFAAAPMTAEADYPSYCEWSSSYDTAQGYPVYARVVLEGGRGTYHTDQGAYGWLYGIEYAPAANQPPGVTLISGSWKFQDGQLGWFKFHVNKSWTQYSGIWGLAGSRTAYSWNGRRIRESAPAPIVTNPSYTPSPVRPTRPVNPLPRPTYPGGRDWPPPEFLPVPGPTNPGGGLPAIGNPSNLPGGTQLKYENGQLRAYDRNGRFLGIVPRRRNQ